MGHGTLIHCSCPVMFYFSTVRPGAGKLGVVSSISAGHCYLSQLTYIELYVLNKWFGLILLYLGDEGYSHSSSPVPSDCSDDEHCPRKDKSKGRRKKANPVRVSSFLDLTYWKKSVHHLLIYISAES